MSASRRTEFIAAVMEGGATLGEAMRGADVAGLPQVGTAELVDALQDLYAASYLPPPGSAPRLEAALRKARIVLSKTRVAT